MSALGIPGHAHPHPKKLYDQVGDLNAYIHAKKQLDLSFLYLRYYTLKNPAI